MGFLDAFRRGGRAGDSSAQVRIGDPRFDDWPVVRDFEDRETAAAFRQQLGEAGVEAVLTADWELDRFGHGDIALRVRGEDYGEAEALLSGYDLD